jgi:hypothetical protein
MREIRAVFDDHTIRVYQAYSAAIAEPALKAQKFVPPFSLSRMTWIKPSFTWMMYRSGWGEKPGQERILAIDINRTGFEWALAHSCLSHFEANRHPDRSIWESALRDSPVRIQWDPERDIKLQPLPWRAIQIGLGPLASREYADSWIRRIEDATDLARKVHLDVLDGRAEDAIARLEPERAYPLPDEISARIGCMAGGV